MNVTITPTPLSGTIKGIASKSLSHRALIAAALSEGESRLENLLDASDINASIEALRALGASAKGARITGPLNPKGHPQIDCIESGSTVRFLIPIAAAYDVPVTFTGSGRLPKRPLDVYETLFKAKGVRYERPEQTHLPLTLEGPLPSGTYKVPGNISSQFITGLLFALPLVEGDSVIEVEEPFESKAYVDLTLATLKRFGIKVTPTPRRYQIPGNQTYTPANMRVEADYSQAAFFLVGGLIGEPITVEGLHPESMQGDKKIIELITAMNGRLEMVGSTITAKPSKTIGKTIDLSQIPDLGPILMILAALCTGKSRFINAGRLRLKESDRLQSMHTVLEAFGVPVKTMETSMEITGVKQLKGNITIDSDNDHRVAMAAAIGAIRADGPVTITNFEAVNKSYPNFLATLKNLGGTFRSDEQ